MEICRDPRVFSIYQNLQAKLVSLEIECVILKKWCCILKNNHSENGRRYFEESRRTKVKLILQIGLRTDLSGRENLLTVVKVTVYFQRCLASKQCSAPALNCRYLNTYIKLKLIELSIKLYQEFCNKMNCRIFHDLEMRASESSFESHKSTRILFFAYLICSSVSCPKAPKNCVCVLPNSIAVKSYRTFSK